MGDDNSTSSPSGWGTIFSGGREHTLGGIEHARSTSWTPADEEAYLNRIKEKASGMAASILDEARREAEQIRQSAREEGYNQGLGDAKEELEAFRSTMADSVNAVLSAIEGQCSQIFTQWREDLMGVSQLAVEKVTSLELSERSTDILEKLLTESVNALETRRNLTIRVNPDDEPVITDIVDAARSKYPDIQAWRVKGDTSVTLEA